MSRSVIERLAALPEPTRTTLLATLSPEAAALARSYWPLWARPEQLAPPGDWLFWVVLAGRGYGKTRMGAEWSSEQAERQPGSRGAIVGRTAADVRDTMIEGRSGLLSVGDPSKRPKYEPSKRRLTWPNGTRATCFSADEPDLLRGPEHHWAWADELAAWRYVDAWDQLMFGMRAGPMPRVVVTTTPRPTPIIRALIADPLAHVTRGRTVDNSRNLSRVYLSRLMAKYAGTTLGRQELDAEVLGETPGALWRRAMLDDHRVRKAPDGLVSRVLGIDPSLSGSNEACETGMVVAGLAADRQAYVLDDLSLRTTPGAWSRLAIQTYRKLRLDAIVLETNMGADALTTILRHAEADLDREALAAGKPRDVPAAIREVRAREGKRARAQPISALYEQGRVHHVGAFAELEDQLCTYVEAEASESPDRLDALVWALTALYSGREPLELEARAPATMGGVRWDPSLVAVASTVEPSGGHWTP